jgi:hypothetical protein
LGVSSNVPFANRAADGQIADESSAPGATKIKLRKRGRKTQFLLRRPVAGNLVAANHLGGKPLSIGVS